MLSECLSAHSIIKSQSQSHIATGGIVQTLNRLVLKFRPMSVNILLLKNSNVHIDGHFVSYTYCHVIWCPFLMTGIVASQCRVVYGAMDSRISCPPNFQNCRGRSPEIYQVVSKAPLPIIWTLFHDVWGICARKLTIPNITDQGTQSSWPSTWDY